MDWNTHVNTLLTSWLKMDPAAVALVVLMFQTAVWLYSVHIGRLSRRRNDTNAFVTSVKELKESQPLSGLAQELLVESQLGFPIARYELEFSERWLFHLEILRGLKETRGFLVVDVHSQCLRWKSTASQRLLYWKLGGGLFSYFGFAMLAGLVASVATKLRIDPQFNAVAFNCSLIGLIMISIAGFFSARHARVALAFAKVAKQRGLLIEGSQSALPSQDIVAASSDSHSGARVWGQGLSPALARSVVGPTPKRKGKRSRRVGRQR